MIKVATLGDEVKEVKFQDGLTLEAALQAAKVTLPKDKFTLTINDKQIDVSSKKAKKKSLASLLEDGAVIVFTPEISNG